MMEVIKVRKYNEVFMKLECESGTSFEISDHFTFTVPGYKFMPAYRNGQWDGKIRLANPYKKLLYSGLVYKLIDFGKLKGYDVQLDHDLLPRNFSKAEALEFIETLKIPEKFKPREHQLKAFVQSVRMGRSLMLSPTSSGKSLIIYLLCMFYWKVYGHKALVIVPSITLVKQMIGDFIEYGGNPDWCHGITAGIAKTTDKPFTISTWQSITKLDSNHFNDYGMILVDECHLAKGKSLTGIMEKATKVQYRFGCTGTLDGTSTHELVTTGLFGPVIEVTTTKEMIDKGYSARFRIKCIVLKWEDEAKRVFSKASYQDEIDWIVTNQRRNKFIKNLALSLEGNVLILFNYKEKQGKVLKDLIESATDRPVYYIDGDVDGNIRNDMRGQIDSQENSISIASSGTTSTGISVKNFNYLIFAHPGKGRIRNLQSIGRMLRVSDKKKSAELIDISDDLSWKTQKNYGMRHFKERLDQYDSEQHPYKIYPVNMEIK